MKRGVKTAFLWAMLILIFLSLYSLFNAPSRNDSKIIFSEFMGDVEKRPESIQKVAIKGDQFTVEYKDNTRRKSVGILDADILARLDKAGVAYEIEERDESPFWQSLMISWLPMLLRLGIFLMFMLQLQAGGGKAMSFGKSKAKLLGDHQNKDRKSVV